MQTHNSSNSDTMEHSTPSSVQPQATTPPATAQPHPNPALAALGRIEPTPGNPKGYPRYELTDVYSYTNTQLNYYLKSRQITNLAAFQKAKKARDELFRSLGNDGNTDIEEMANQSPSRQSSPQPRQGSRLASETPAETESFAGFDSEPDEVFPVPKPGGKGLKIDKITTLKRGQGLLNYCTWLYEAQTAFRADPYRFDTAEKRVIFAALNMDDDMRELWAFEQQEQPQLAGHWKKFQQWAEEAHLHREADFDKAFQQYRDATQGKTEDPIIFYTRLTKLAHAV